MGALAALYRHPVKSLGEEALPRAALEPGRPIAWDRVWAVAHGRSEWDPAAPAWATSRNFVIQSFNPKLAQIACALDEATETIRLAHPERGEVTVRPEADGPALTGWLAPLASEPGPFRIARAPGGAMHDFPDTHLSIGNLASLRALEEMAGQPLAHIRFRMNLWLDGFAPWEELGWTGMAVGPARLRVIGRVARCNATNADPDTGARNTELPKLLHARFGHADFGVYAQVERGGEIAPGAEARAA